MGQINKNDTYSQNVRAACASDEHVSATKIMGEGSENWRGVSVETKNKIKLRAMMDVPEC